jgi:hypothetical protein
MIRKYQNELIVLVALLVLVAGIAYRYAMHARLERVSVRAQKTEQQIRDIGVLKKVWSTKGLKNQAAKLRNAVPTASVQSFELGNQELKASFGPLSSQQLNDLTTKIASLPLRWQELTIERNGKNYTVRCRCSW